MERLLGFRPTFWTSFWGLIVLAILIGLGTWQIERLEWKRGILAEINERIAAAPEPLPQSFDPAEWDYRAVTFAGEYLHDREQHLVWNNEQGRGGYAVFTPMRLEDGRVVIVNRGWVPFDQKDPASRAQGQVEGVVTAQGLVREPWGAGWLSPDNDPVENVWFWPDLSAMARAMQLESAPAFFIDLKKMDVPGGLPQGGQTVLNIRNDHLQYAVTWYSLALIFLVMWVLWNRARAREEHQA